MWRMLKVCIVARVCPKFGKFSTSPVTISSGVSTTSSPQKTIFSPH